MQHVMQVWEEGGRDVAVLARVPSSQHSQSPTQVGSGVGEGIECLAVRLESSANLFVFILFTYTWVVRRPFYHFTPSPRLENYAYS